MHLFVVFLALCVTSICTEGYTELETEVIFVTTCTGCGDGVGVAPSVKVNDSPTWDHVSQVLNHFYANGYAIESHVASRGVQNIVLLKKSIH